MGNEKLSRFIAENRLSAEQYDMNSLLNLFTTEMEAGLSAKGGSLLMLPSYVYTGKAIKAGERVAVIDAGGTNFRTALVWFDENGQSHIEGFKKCPMPGSQEAITKEQFFGFIADSVGPYLKETNKITLSFAYPTEILSIHDGRIVRLVKELRVSGIEGCYINRELGAALEARGFKGMQTYITNDSVATAMAGLSAAQRSGYVACIGLIVGTGLNICYPERSAEIKKLNLTGTRRMIINTESGNFNKTPRGPIDAEFDAATNDPGHQQLEKMISGGYFGALAGRVLEKAAASGLLEAPVPEGFSLQTSDVSDFLEGNADSKLSTIFSAQEDRGVVKLLLQSLVERAALLVAVQIAAVAKKAAGEGGRVYATVEGTMFYKMPGIRKKTAELMETWVRRSYGIEILLAEEANAVLRGSAIIALI